MKWFCPDCYRPEEQEEPPVLTIMTKHGLVELGMDMVALGEAIDASGLEKSAWLIGNEFGALALVWESCEQDALDEAADCGLLKSKSVDPCREEVDNDDERFSFLGNDDAPYYTEYLWMSKVDLGVLQIEAVAKHFGLE